MAADPMLPPIEGGEGLPPPDESAEESSEPTAGGTRDAIREALDMVGDVDFLAALDDAGELQVTIDLDSGDITFAAGDVSVSVPAHLMTGASG